MNLKNLDVIKDSVNCVDCFGDTHNVAGFKALYKINEIIKEIDFIEEEFPNQANALSLAIKHLTERIENLEKTVDALVKENNIHESQIDKLQMKVEPEKLASARTISEIEDAKAKRSVTFIAPTGFDPFDRLDSAKQLTILRQKLDIAVNALNTILCGGDAYDIFDTAQEALDQIMEKNND